MSIIDEVAKIVKSFKPVEIKSEIKNPSFAPIINYKPTTNNFNVGSIEMSNVQLNNAVDKISDDNIEGIKERVVGSIAINDNLQTTLSGLPKEQLLGYLKTSIAGTATISQIQPDFQNSGSSLFPISNPEEIFKMGYKAAGGHNQLLDVKISKNSDDTITITYQEN